MTRSVAILLSLVATSVLTLGSPLCCIARASCCADAQAEKAAEAADSAPRCPHCRPEAPASTPAPAPQKKQCECKHAHPPLSVDDEAVDLEPAAVVVATVAIETLVLPAAPALATAFPRTPPPGGGLLTLPLLL